MTGGASSQQGHSREGTLPNIDRVVLRKVESVRISPHTSLLTAAYALLPAPTTQCVHISPHTSPLTAAYSPLLLHSMQCPFKHVNLSPHTCACPCPPSALPSVRCSSPALPSAEQSSPLLSPLWSSLPPLGKALVLLPFSDFPCCPGSLPCSQYKLRQPHMPGLIPSDYKSYWTHLDPRLSPLPMQRVLGLDAGASHAG